MEQVMRRGWWPVRNGAVVHGNGVVAACPMVQGNVVLVIKLKRRARS